MMGKELSICIVGWNVREFLKRCLDSIEEARPRLDYEVIVVDNASRDGSAVLVKEEFPRVTLVRNRRNRGFAAACNQAIELSRGKFILLLNPDTIVTPGALEEMIRFLRDHPEAGGAGPRLLNPDGSSQPSARAFPNFKSALQQFTILGSLGFFRGEKRRYLMKAFDYDQPGEIDQPMGSALFFRKDAVVEVGGMDETFFLYFEEVDLCRRLRQADYSLWYNPRAAIIHFGGASTDQADARAMFWLLQSLLYYFKKHRGREKTARFKIIFKPLFIIGLLWGLIRNGVELAVKFTLGYSRLRVRRSARRLKGRLRFLTDHLIRFLLKA